MESSLAEVLEPELDRTLKNDVKEEQQAVEAQASSHKPSRDERR
jgi:hypothetical protein